MIEIGKIEDVREEIQNFAIAMENVMRNKDCNIKRAAMDTIITWNEMDRLFGRQQFGQCHNKIILPGKFCLNVAVAGSIVMFDRLNKG